MKLLRLIAFFGFIVQNTFATNYYVSPTGNDNNDGLTLSTSFQSPSYAAFQASAGDTVFFLAGTYTNANPSSNVLDIFNSGNLQFPIVFKNHTDNEVIFKLNENNWSGIALQGADYIVIDGINIIGNNDNMTVEEALAQMSNLSNPATSGNGIGITSEYGNSDNRPHHNIIRNCHISKCGGGGIYTYGADYTTIENNIISECAWYSPYDNSAISLYQNWNSDSFVGIKNYITGNICYRNENYVPFLGGDYITDGNGIIIDDGRNTQNASTLGIYLGGTYIANNLVYDNGGRGIHCYLSDHVIAAYNTCYHNCQSPSTQEGELTAFSSDNITFVNNLVLPDTNIPPITHSSENTGTLTVENNLWGANSSLANPIGVNTVIGNANFVMPSNDPSIANFHLLQESDAIDSGSALFAPIVDLEGTSRPINGLYDIGCYEYDPSNTHEELATMHSVYRVFPNPSQDEIFLLSKDNSNSVAQINVYNESGKLVISKQPFHLKQENISISALPSGKYIIQVMEQNHKTEVMEFIKTHH
jgi:parallel beta-helix repeat protein